MRRATLAERAKAARERMAAIDPARFGDPGKAAKTIGCARTLVVSWEDGTAKSIGSPTIFDAAVAYRVRPDYLALRSDDDGYPWQGFANSSQPTRLDASKLATVLETVEAASANVNRPLTPAAKARLAAALYAHDVAGPKSPGPGSVVSAALADILSSLEEPES